MIESPTPQGSPQARVQDILMLPPLPAVAARLLERVSREDCSIDELAALIEQDPGLTARIIGIANSAYFARRTEICSVSDAIIRVLGLNLVRGIAIGIALSKPFDAGACPGFQLDRYWYLSIQTATLAERLGALGTLEGAQRDCLFLSGLLHNLGQLVLVHAFPDRMSQVFQARSRTPGESLPALETRHLAMNEFEAGSILARRWQLPSTATGVITYLGEPRRAGAAMPVVQLLRYCAELAETWYQDPGAPAALITDAGPALSGLDPERIERTLQQVRVQEPQTRAMAESLARAT